MKNLPHGYTLIELLITISILAILTCMSYPTYHEKTLHIKRLEGQLALLDLANRMEYYHEKHHSYAKASIGTGQSNDILANSITSHGYYRLNIIQTTSLSYTLQATALFEDNACSVLTYDGLTRESATGTQPNICWQ